MASTADGFPLPDPAEPSPQSQARQTPQERCVSISALCSYGWRPIMLTGYLIDHLVRHFTAENIEDDDLRRYVWREGERTGILIESIYAKREDLLEKRPAVLVKRNAMKNLRLYLGERSGVTGQGHLEYTTYWVGSHTLFCIQGSGASVEILATEVQREITEFAQVLLKYLRLMRLSVLEVGEVSEIEEAKEGFCVPITVGWVYEESWRLELESLALRKTPLSVLLNGALIQRTQ